MFQKFVFFSEAGMATIGLPLDGILDGMGFLSLNAVDVLGKRVPRRGDRPMHCRMPRSSPGSYPLDASSNPEL